MQPGHHFDTEIKDLHQMILRMGSLVEDAVRKSVIAFGTDNSALAEQVIADDAVIDRIQIDLENSAMRIIASEQPVARGLRELVTATRIAANLERIGDHARHIAKAVGKIPMEVRKIALPSVKLMSDIGISMIHDSLSAYVKQDIEVAKEVAERDDAIDAERRVLYGRLITLMQEKPEWIDHGVSLMFLNRFLERLGDHVTDVCQWVVFAESGEYVELNK